MPIRNGYLSALARARSADPYADEPSADELLAQAHASLDRASSLEGSIDRDPQVRAATDAARGTRAAYDDLQNELSRIDRGAATHTRDIELGGPPSPAEPEDNRSFLGKVADWFTQPIAPVRRQMERNQAFSAAEQRMKEAGAEVPQYSPVRDATDQLLMGQLSPAGIASAAAPFAGAGRLGALLRSGLKVGDIVGAPVEAGRAISSAREGNYSEGAQHAVQAGLMGLGAMAPWETFGGTKQGEVVHEPEVPGPEPLPPSRQLSSTTPDDIDALADVLGLPPGASPRALPPRGPLVTPPPPEPTWSDRIPSAGGTPPGQPRVRTTPRGSYEPAPEVPPSSRPPALEGDVLPPDQLPPERRIAQRGSPPDIDTEAIQYPEFEGQLIDDLLQLPPAGPIITPPGRAPQTPAALPPRGPLVTPPPSSARSFFDRIPAAGGMPPGETPPQMSRQAPPPTFTSAQPEARVAPSGPYRPQRLQFLGKRVAQIDVSGDQPTLTFDDGKTMPVNRDLVDSLRDTADPNIPQVPPAPEPIAPEPNVDAPNEARQLRENRNTAALERYRGQFDPMQMQAIEQFAQRNPRVFSTFSIEPGAPAGATHRADFTPFAEPQGSRVGRVRFRDVRPGDTPEDFLQALEHEATHATQARRMGGLSFAEQALMEDELPYRQQPLEQSAFGVQEGRAAKRAAATSDQDALSWLEEQIGHAAKNKTPEELARAAYTDPLTSLPNRRGFEELNQRAGGEPLHVVGDLRNFKAVNDLLGQSRGDDLLRAFSEELTGTLRRGDVPGRIGGDEFALALQGVSPEGRAAVQQKLADATSRALSRFGATHAGEHPIGARFGYGATREEALAELNRQKELETGPKYRDLSAGKEAVSLSKPPSNPVPGVRYEMPASSVATDPERFQYRQGTNKAGVSEERQLEGKYEPAQGGILAVWKDPQDGKTYVVNGHHRLDLAKQHNANVGVVYLDAPDAPSARAAGAVINLREGNSSMQDAVNFIRDSGMPPDRLSDFGISRRSTIGRDAPAIAGLSDPVRERWASGEVPDDIAATIGHAQLGPEQQHAVMQLLDRQQKAGKPVSAPVLKNLVQQVQRSSSVNLAGTGDQGNIFDLLGDDRRTSTALQRAELTDWVRNQLSRDRRLFGYVSKGERAGRLGAAGVADVDVAKAGNLADQAKAVGGVFDRLEQSTGPISEALNRASERIMTGEEPHAVRQDLLAAVRSGVETELRGEPAVGASRSGEAAPVPLGRTGTDQIREVGLSAGAPAGRTAPPAIEDLLATGERQPRLPGAGQAREVEHGTPQTAEAPFALQREAARGPTATQQALDAMHLERPRTGIDELERVLEREPARSTYDELPENVRDYLTRRLKYTRDDINAMSPDEAIATGKANTFNPRLTDSPKEASSRYNAALDELSKTFEAEQPGRIQRAAERKRAARGGAVPVGAPGEEASPAEASPARLARSRELAQETAAEAEPTIEGRKRTPSELRAIQSEQTQRARAIGKAIESRDYDEAARLIGEQAERWNAARLREGTGGEEKIPPKYRNGEYLASDFATLHRFLFTPEGRRSLADAGRELGRMAVAMAQNPVIRGIAGGLIGASTGKTTDEQIQRGIAGMIIAAGTPGGYRALRQALEHYQRTGSIMRKSPQVSNRDIGYWRAFVAPSTVERTVPEVYAAVRDVMKDLQNFRRSGDQNPATQQAYAKLARRDMVAFVKEEADAARARGQKNLAARLDATARDLGGQLTSGQRVVKQVLEHTGLKANASGREFEKLAQRHIYRIALGYAIDSAAKNLFQPTLALLHVSPRNLLRGMAAARTPEARRLFDSLELELHRPVESANDVDELLNRVGTAVSDSGRFMRATDNWNRRAVFMGSLAEQGALEDALRGRAPQQALDEAARVMRMTQGEPGALSGNPFLRGPIGGTFKPFTKYPNLVIENMLDAFQGEAKYPKQAVLSMMALGLTGAAFGLNLTDVLIGGARAFGIDPFHPRDMQLPPVVQAGRRASQYVTGEKRLLGDFIPTSGNADEVLNSDLATLIAGRYPVKVAKTLHNIGGTQDPVGDLLSLLGMTTEQRQQRLDTSRAAHEFATETRQQHASDSARLRSAYSKASQRGDEVAMQELEQRAREMRMKPQDLRGLRRRASQGDLERLRRSIPLDQRQEFDRLFGQAAEQEREQRR